MFVQQIVDRPLMFGVHPNFVTQVAGKADAAHDARDAVEGHLANVHELHGLMRDIFVRKSGKQVTGLWT